MRQIINYILMVVPFLVVTSINAQQTNSRNYILSRSYKQAGANADDVSKVVTQVQYIDGLGRSLQNVTVGQSPAGTDIVLPFEYDAAGRQSKQYLPYVAGGRGSYKANALTDVGAWYLSNSAGLQAGSPASTDLTRPYQETVFEASPLSRTSAKREAGTRSRSSSLKYKVNAIHEVVQYNYNPGTNTIETSGDYLPGALKCTVYKDPQDFETREYADVLGHLVCKRVMAADAEDAPLSTYYIYDDLGLLRGVLQPNFQDDASFTNSAFLYDYDDQGRMIGKRVPGGGNTGYVYDKFDRVILSQDANQMARKVWAFTKYDELNRPIMTGELSSDKSRSEWQAGYDAAAGSLPHHENTQGATGLGYTLNLTSVPAAGGFQQVSETDVLTVTYYDNYDFPKPASFIYSSSAGYAASAATAVKSLVTGGRVRALPGNSTTPGDWLVNVVYYDAEYRPVQTVRELHELGTGATERVSTRYKYDLAPIVAEQKTVQVVGGVTYSHVVANSYDHADRILEVKETITAGTKTKTAYTLAQRYNTLGQLQSKWFHAYATDDHRYRRRTTYTNNIQGWLTDAKTAYQIDQGADLPFYAFSLSYDNVLDNALYSNGNISRMEWLGKDQTAFSGGLSFTYDKANRLLASGKPAAATYTYSDTESGITYDKNGNIKTLIRAGAATDELTYSYVGNRLTAINDAAASSTGVKSGASSYDYDANGNMISDGNRGATLSYNFLNLPRTVTVGGKTFQYDYDASGNKHRYKGDTINIKYAGRFEYDGNNVLKRVATGEGQLVPSGDTLRFDYYLKDHLGNVRVVWDESGTILQKNDYYPFGLEIDRNSPVQTLAARNTINRYNFLGKETQISTGYIDLSRRFYDPTIGRFMQVDPVTDTQEEYSAFQYSWNNPILRSDPNGDCPFCPAIPYLAAAAETVTATLVEAALTAGAMTVVKKLAEKAGAGAGLYSPGVGMAMSTSKSGDLTGARLKASSSNSSAGSTSESNENSTSGSESGNYSNLKEPKNIRDGGKTTPAQRQRILQENKKQNQGELVSDGDGRQLNPPKQNRKGEKADMNQAEVDHVIPRSKGGSNSNSNLRVISKEENLKKGNRQD